MPRKLPNRTNMKIVKIKEKYDFPCLPILSLTILAMNPYDNSAKSCHRPGILARDLTAKTIRNVVATTASTIKAEEFVKEASKVPILMGING